MRYSLPASFANRPVSLRISPERIVTVAEGPDPGDYNRLFVRSMTAEGQRLSLGAPRDERRESGQIKLPVRERSLALV